MSNISITITGDFVPNQKTHQLIKDGKSDQFAPEVSEKIKQSDISIVNLETPLTTNKNPIEKTGNNFMAHPDNIELIKEMGFDTITLANNHILDQDEQGLFDTINTCHKNGIKTVGAGKNLEDARKPLIINIKDKKIGIINLCEKEFSIATEKSAGANPFTAIDAYYQINAIRDKVDYIIVIFHGGLEYHHIPLPGFIKNCRYMIDVGADAVVCHHTHYISGYEYYEGKPIFYGLGNFYSSSVRNDAELIYSYLSDIKFNPYYNSPDFSITGIRKNKFNNRIFLIKNNRNIDNKIKYFNEIISDQQKLLDYWNNTNNTIKNRYLNLVTSKSKVVYQIKKRLPFLIKKNKFLYKNLLNIVKCDSHREMIIKILEKL